MSEPKEGLLTFRAEGNNFRGSRYYSRVIHWPGHASACQGDASGVTIGRGFDMGSRTTAESRSYLIKAGIAAEKAEKISTGSRLKFCEAEKFVRQHKNEIGEITELQQLMLFEAVYPEYVNKAKRFYNKYKGANAVAWRELHPVLKEVFIDMRYQGAMTIGYVSSFKRNEIGSALKLIESIGSLYGKDRYIRRREALKNAL
ncbi:hypothetical protein EGK14_15300 [Erwinia sp. 198]|nr:hypothetical protein EGK14_15300 [Erwinia sp. 198]